MASNKDYVDGEQRKMEFSCTLVVNFIYVDVSLHIYL